MKVDIRTSSQSKLGASTFLLIPPAGQSYLSKFSNLEDSYNFIELDYDLKDPSQVLDYAEQALNLLESRKIKSISVVGLGQGGALAQAIAVRTWRILRRLVLLDSYTRLTPTWFEQLVDRIESYLPLGLPLRKLSAAYDSRCELHRIHCPTLIVRNSNFDLHLEYQAQLLNKFIPNSWLKKIKSEQELYKLLIDFEQVPAKKPQKSL